MLYFVCIRHGVFSINCLAIFSKCLKFKKHFSGSDVWGGGGGGSISSVEAKSSGKPFNVSVTQTVILHILQEIL